MKIAVFEVREDEKNALHRLEETDKVSLFLTEKPYHSPDQLPPGTEAVSVLGQSPLDAGALAGLKAAGVRWISTRTVGTDHIDLQAAKKLGLRVCNAAYPPNGVADFTVMLMLLALRHYKPALWRQQVNDYSLEGLMGQEMKNQTVGIIGTGRIGAAVIQNLTGFGCRILACDPVPKAGLDALAQYVDLATLLRESTVISVHLPLTQENRHLINRQAIAQMRPGVVLINTARGELMELSALKEGIENQKIGALGMDVFENESGIYHQNRKTDILRNEKMAYLRQFPNVILTQHMAFYTDTNVSSMVDCGIRGILKMASGERCPWEV